MRELQLSEIWIYPIKSLGGIRVKSARVLEKGLEYDRRWMLVDEQNRFITQREHPKLSQFSVALGNTSLQIIHRKNSATLSIPLYDSVDKYESVQIWDDQVQASEVSAEVSDWFSAQLNFPCRLVRFPEQHARPVDPDYALRNEHVSLADGYPYLIIGQASLDDLNNRLTEPISMQRFRPNFVFTGGVPYEEDHWKKFSVGSNHFIGVKNCSRCVLTTVDPQTGTAGIEPLRTLSTFRQRNNKIYFGQNLLAIDHATVHEGDPIRLL